jgi:predicted PurR-regulated permease PerM
MPSVSNKVVYAAYGLALLALYGVLKLGLLSALFMGLLVYSMIQFFADKFSHEQHSQYRSRVMVVALIALTVVGGLITLAWFLGLFFHDTGALSLLFNKLADALDRSRGQLPSLLQSYIPVGAEELRTYLMHWFREHAAEAKFLGAETGRLMMHGLLGMIIAAVVALEEHGEAVQLKPLAALLSVRVAGLAEAFRQIVFAQIRISLINTALTATFLLVVLPSFGIHFPLSKALILFTFFAGLLPVIGNLLSNTTIVILGLSCSLSVALACLLFLVVIHKLEYFLNARIIGSQIHARTWELLVVLLVMEAWWGMAGMAAAPVYYAYLKQELRRLEWV